MTTTTIPQRRDPVARMALLALVAAVSYLAAVQPAPEAARADAVIIVPTQALPTAAPTALPVPTAEPVVLQAAPTFAPPVVEQPAPIIQQVIVERVEQQIVIATPTPEPPPEPTAQPVQIIATVENGMQMPSGAIVIVPPTPGPGDPGFAESFEDPNTAATCAFVGCLP